MVFWFISAFALLFFVRKKDTNLKNSILMVNSIQLYPYQVGVKRKGCEQTERVCERDATCNLFRPKVKDFEVFAIHSIHLREFHLHQLAASSTS